MDPAEQDRHLADLDALVEAEVDRASGVVTLVARVFLGLALGGVLVGVGGILVLAALATQDPRFVDGPVGTLLVAGGAALMAAGPVAALRVAGLRWWQALVLAPALGVIAYAVVDVLN